MIIKVKKTGLLGKLYEYGDVHIIRRQLVKNMQTTLSNRLLFLLPKSEKSFQTKITV